MFFLEANHHQLAIQLQSTNKLLHEMVILFSNRYTICIGRSEDRSFMRKLRLKTLVLDEGHMLKNMATLKYNHLMKIQVGALGV